MKYITHRTVRREQHTDLMYLGGQPEKSFPPCIAIRGEFCTNLLQSPFTPVCFVVNVHYRNGALLESFPWDSEVDDINRLTSKDYGEAMSQAINWIREQTEQPAIDQPVPQQPRLAA